MTYLRTIGVVTLLAATLAGCEKTVEAPMDVGVCYAVAKEADGKVKFNKVAVNQPRIENCAVQLEWVRLRFMGLGSNNREVIGAYQGNFIWVNPAGVEIAQELNGHPYPSLFRGDDGRLIIPGAVPATPGSKQ
jgi:hypothetical protein